MSQNFSRVSSSIESRTNDESASESDYLGSLVEAFEEMIAEAETRLASSQVRREVANRLQPDPLLHCQPK